MTKPFILQKDMEIQEINSRVKIYTHHPTGAKIMAVLNDEENKSFGITFRTPTYNSKGTPHIMEHTVLCGSKNYPLKEPFIELAKSSLNTYLNAMTYPDRTVYPVASQNLRDLYNLARVYLDAVFFPLLEPESFAQEGWHYEMDSPDDKLRYGGVVFNEMKGVYSDSENFFYRFLRQQFYRGHIYSNDSGGDPREIPELSYEEFLQFHRKYYHPSNSWIFFYGDLDEGEMLEFLQEYLGKFDKKEDINSEIPEVKPWSEPRTAEGYFDYPEEGDDVKKGMITVNWLLPGELTPETELTWDILSYMLLSTPASPLRRALLESGLGESLLGSGFSSSLRGMTFSTGMLGVAGKDLDKVEELIFSQLETIAEEGFDPELLEAAFNMLEFNLRENNTGSFPRGLSMMLDVLTYWLYEIDPLPFMAYEKPLARVKELLTENPGRLQEMIRTDLLGNNSRLTVKMKPKKGLREQEEKREREKLDSIQAQLSPKEIEEIVEKTALLKKRQETPDPPEVVEKLPALRLEDIDRKGREYPLEKLVVADSTVLFHDIFTNGIIYFKAAFDLSALPEELIPYLTLYSTLLTEVGTEKLNEIQLAQLIRRKTGGIAVFPQVMTREDNGEPLFLLFLTGKATVKQGSDLLSIFRELLFSVNFDNFKKVKEVVLLEKASKENSLIYGGSAVVANRINAHFSPGGQFSERMVGIEKLFFIRNLAENFEKEWPRVLENLKRIHQIVIDRASMVTSITLDEKNWKIFYPELEKFIREIPSQNKERVEYSTLELPQNEGLTISSQVNFVGKGFDLYKLGYTYDASLRVILNHLRTVYLWERVRMQGGAYGGSCNFNHNTGVFIFTSYRDPHLERTLKVYDEAAEYLRKLSLSPREIERTIIGTIGDIDQYKLPDAKGYTAMLRYLVGSTPEMRQKRREEILNTELKHFREFGEVLGDFKTHGHVVILGAEEKLSSLPYKLKLTKVQ